MIKLTRWLLRIGVAVGISLPALLPLFGPQFFHTHDYTHVARLTELVTALDDGHFPVRWSKHLGFGYGLPQFQFYAPLPYYMAAAFYGVGFSPIDAIKTVVIVNFVGAFLAMYYLSKALWGRQGGLIAATAYIYLPYRAVDVYVRGALGELTAMTFLTLALTTLVWYFKNHKPLFLLWFSVAIAGISTSHNLVTLMSVPVVASAGIFFWLVSPKRQWSTFFRWVASGFLGMGLAGFFILPAFLEKHLVAVESLTQGFSNYKHHFLYLRQLWYSKWGYGGSIFGLEDSISFEIGRVHIILIVVAALLFLWQRKRVFSKDGLMVLFWVGVTAVSVLMTTFKTEFIWDSVPLLKYIQFPWRFLVIIGISVSVLTGAVMRWCRGNFWRGLFTFLSVLTLVVYGQPLFKPRGYLEDNDILYYTDPARIQQEMSAVIPDFMPLSVSNYSQLPAFPGRYTFEGGNATSEVLIDRTHEFYVRTQVFEPTQLIINIAYFPGWEIFVNGVRVEPMVDSTLGVMRVPLSANEWIVSGRFTETPLRKMADGISALSLLIWGYLAVRLERRETVYA